MNGAMGLAAREVAGRLAAAGFRALFAGGCVRDALLGRCVKDIDIATSATPDEVEALFAGRTVAVGKAFGVVLVRHGGFTFDVATFRTDGDYRDGRRPESVAFATPEGDAQRRDFTVNGLFMEPESGAVIDYVGGMGDLRRGVMRAIGEPAARFREDKLRMLRAVRFAAVLGFELEAATRQAVCEHAAWIRAVSAERVAVELERMLCEAPRPSRALELLRETGLLELVLPEVAAMAGVRQPPQFHPEGDVWTHTCLMLDALPPPRGRVLMWSVLLHDVGKPPTFEERPEPGGGTRIRFQCHAAVGAEMAEAILRRLKLPSAVVESVKTVVADHMTFVDAEKMRRSKLRRFLGAAHFPVLLELMRLDVTFSNGDLRTWEFLRDAYVSFRDEPVLPEPLVHGRDLIAWGVAPGPAMGALLREVYDAQLEGRVRTLEEARGFVETYRAEHGEQAGYGTPSLLL